MFRDKIMAGLKNMKPLLGRPFLGYVALIGLSQFITLGMYVHIFFLINSFYLNSMFNFRLRACHKEEICHCKGRDTKWYAKSYCFKFIGLWDPIFSGDPDKGKGG